MEWGPGTKGMSTGIRPMSSLLKWERGYSNGVNKKEFYLMHAQGGYEYRERSEGKVI